MTQTSVNLADSDTGLTATCTVWSTPSKTMRAFRVSLTDKTKSPPRVFCLHMKSDEAEVSSFMGECDANTLRPEDWRWVVDALCALLWP